MSTRHVQETPFLGERLHQLTLPAPLLYRALLAHTWLDVQRRVGNPEPHETAAGDIIELFGDADGHAALDASDHPLCSDMLEMWDVHDLHYDMDAMPLRDVYRDLLESHRVVIDRAGQGEEMAREFERFGVEQWWG